MRLADWLPAAAKLRHPDFRLPVARSGQLLGIVNAKLVGRGIEGIGFAIPAGQVAEALQLKYVN